MIAIGKRVLKFKFKWGKESSECEWEGDNNVISWDNSVSCGMIKVIKKYDTVKCTSYTKLP